MTGELDARRDMRESYMYTEEEEEEAIHDGRAIEGMEDRNGCNQRQLFARWIDCFPSPESILQRGQPKLEKIEKKKNEDRNLRVSRRLRDDNLPSTSLYEASTSHSMKSSIEKNPAKAPNIAARSFQAYLPIAQFPTRFDSTDPSERY